MINRHVEARLQGLGDDAPESGYKGPTVGTIEKDTCYPPLKKTPGLPQTDPEKNTWSPKNRI